MRTYQLFSEIFGTNFGSNIRNYLNRTNIRIQAGLEDFVFTIVQPA